MVDYIHCCFSGGKFRLLFLDEPSRYHSITLRLRFCTRVSGYQGVTFVFTSLFSYLLMTYLLVYV
jgi:hypothetical protein